jgi:hypothetical protein
VKVWLPAMALVHCEVDPEMLYGIATGDGFIDEMLSVAEPPDDIDGDNCRLVSGFDHPQEDDWDEALESAAVALGRRTGKRRDAPTADLLDCDDDLD